MTKICFHKEVSGVIELSKRVDENTLNKWFAWFRSNPWVIALGLITGWFTLVGGINDTIDIIQRAPNELSSIFAVIVSLIVVVLLVSLIHSIRLLNSQSMPEWLTVVSWVMLAGLLISIIIAALSVYQKEQSIRQKVVIAVADFFSVEAEKYQVTEELIRQLNLSLEGL